MDAHTGAALATNQDQLALGNEVIQFEHARFTRNLAAPEVHNANVVDSVTAVSDTPKQMYVTLGWRPVAVKRIYLKVRSALSQEPMKY